MDGSLMDEVLLVLPFILWLQSATMPLRHPLSRVPLSLQPPHFVAVAGYAALPIGRMTQENPSLDFLGYCRSRGLLHVTKSRLHALFAYWQERIKHACKEKSFRGFFLDCRSQGLLHVANPPSMARYSLARKNKTCLQENPSMAQYSLARNKSVPCTRSAASSGPSKGTFPQNRHLLNGGVLPCLLLQFL
ncbi:MAG: hypothetical protein J6P28_08415 [Treponema sp.]|nr:hypothetical protein [Treponema sp.]